MEPDGKHFVLKGGVRYEAALQAGVAFLPCVLKVFKSDDELRRYAESDEAREFNSLRDC
jgi:ParB-like chromosome segregation protein Spo0J